MKSDQIVQLDDDDEDEFKPLFDYSDTVPPAPQYISSDDSDDDIVVTKSTPPKRKLQITPTKEPSTPTPHQNQPHKEILDDDDDDDSWLETPSSKMPKLVINRSAIYARNQVLHRLRLQRMELQIMHHNTSPEALRRVEEMARLQAQQRPEAEPPSVVRTPPRGNSHQEAARSEPAAPEKEKVLLRVQDNSGNSQLIRIFATDKFEKLFKAYAHQIQVPLEKLVFRFDGDDISHNSTPKELDLEDDDIVEAYIKS